MIFLSAIGGVIHVYSKFEMDYGSELNRKITKKA